MSCFLQYIGLLARLVNRFLLILSEGETEEDQKKKADSIYMQIVIIMGLGGYEPRFY